MFSVRPFENRTLSWWFQQRGNIDMTPVYQRRGGLWNPNDKAYLIDSILNDFDIPKIYIADFTYVPTPLNQSSSQFAVIDGRQRFEAIFDFFDGTLPLNRGFIYSEEPSLRLGGLGYNDLRQNYPRVAAKFENFNLSVVSVITDEEPKISELFVRLNRSKPLAGAEIRNAMTGKVPAVTRELANHKFFGTRVRFQVNRGQDLNAATKLLITEFTGALVDTKKVHLDRFVEEGIKTESDDIERAADRVKNLLDAMLVMFLEHDPLLSSQGPLTVYYWFFRVFGGAYSSAIREFLVRFEERRRQNRELAKTNSMFADRELLLYDNLNRSTNDKGSLEGRFAILSAIFLEFLETGEVKPLTELEAVGA